MKKSILAITLASILSSGAANAATVYQEGNGDHLKIYGGAEVGGLIVSDTDHSPEVDKNTYVDDSFATIGLAGATGDFYAKFELDAERDGSKDNNYHIVIDKLFVGYNLTPYQSLEFGRTDTAYDRYDALGDVTDEFGIGISEAGDQDKTIKYSGVFGNFNVGISHSLDGWDGELNELDDPIDGSNITDSRYLPVTNGYIGYFGETFTILTGGEKGDESEIYSLHGIVVLDSVTISGLVFDQTKNFNKGADSNKFGVNLGISYAFNEKLNLIGNLNYEDSESSDKISETKEFMVVGFAYRYAQNIKLVAEVAYGDVLADNKQGALGWTKIYYSF